MARIAIALGIVLSVFMGWEALCHETFDRVFATNGGYSQAVLDDCFKMDSAGVYH